MSMRRLLLLLVFLFFLAFYLTVSITLYFSMFIFMLNALSLMNSDTLYTIDMYRCAMALIMLVAVSKKLWKDLCQKCFVTLLVCEVFRNGHLPSWHRRFAFISDQTKISKHEQCPLPPKCHLLYLICIHLCDSNASIIIWISRCSRKWTPKYQPTTKNVFRLFGFY